MAEQEGPWSEYAKPAETKGPWQDYAPPPPAKPSKSLGDQAKDFAKTLGSDILSIPGAVGSALLHPIDTVTGTVKESKESLSKALEALKKGNYSEAHKNATEAIPLLGKFVTGTTEDIQKGDLGKAGARMAELALAPKVAERVPAAIAGVRAGLKEAVPKSRVASAVAEAYRNTRNPPPVAVEPVPAPSTLDPQFHGPVAPVEPIAVPPPQFTYSGTATQALAKQAPRAPRAPAARVEVAPTEVPAVEPITGELPSGRKPGPVSPPTQAATPAAPEPVAAPVSEKGRAPRPTDDFYKVHGQVRKAMKAAADLHSQGITAEQLQALSPAERAKALKGHSGETFERILFELRGLETGKITP